VGNVFEHLMSGAMLGAVAGEVDRGPQGADVFLAPTAHTLRTVLFNCEGRRAQDYKKKAPTGAARPVDAVGRLAPAYGSFTSYAGKGP